MTDPIEELNKQDMTPDRALEIVNRIQGPQGIAAAKKEIEAQIENRKTMMVKLQAQIEAFQAFSRTLGALEKVWGLTTAPNKPLTELAEGVDKVQASNEDAVKQYEDEIKKRTVEGKCAYKAPSIEGGEWCDRMLKTRDEKKLGYCMIHAHKLGLVKSDVEESEEKVSQKKVKSKG